MVKIKDAKEFYGIPNSWEYKFDSFGYISPEANIKGLEIYSSSCNMSLNKKYLQLLDHYPYMDHVKIVNLNNKFCGFLSCNYNSFAPRLRKNNVSGACFDVYKVSPDRLRYNMNNTTVYLIVPWKIGLSTKIEEAFELEFLYSLDGG